MEQSSSKDESASGLLKNFFWISTIIAVAIISYFIGTKSNSSTPATAPKTSSPQQSELTIFPSQPPSEISSTPTVNMDKVCAKNGLSQKKDYLISYTIKTNDSITSIASQELGDATRTSEILQLNENPSSLTIGSIFYLPPVLIKQSSGNIKEVSGMIVKKDNASWQLSYGGGSKGLGLWMPGYWFSEITDKDSYVIGDCVTILFDNGFKVYSVKKF